MSIWSKQELKVLDRFYSNTSDTVLSNVMGRSTDSIRKKARRMGLCKVQVRDKKLRSRSGVSVNPQTVVNSLS